MSNLSLDSLYECESESKTNPVEEAHIYFQQSGILGQLKKTSKAFIATKADAINVEQVWP